MIEIINTDDLAFFQSNSNYLYLPNIFEVKSQLANSCLFAIEFRLSSFFLPYCGNFNSIVIVIVICIDHKCNQCWKLETSEHSRLLNFTMPTGSGG